MNYQSPIIQNPDKTISIIPDILEHGNEYKNDYNKLGLRTTNIDFKKKWILAVGDSNTFGIGLKLEERYTNKLEKLIGIRIYNAGIPGAGNDLIYDQLLAYMQYNPIVIIVQFSLPVRFYSIKGNTIWRQGPWSGEDHVLQFMVKKEKDFEQKTLEIRNKIKKFNLPVICFNIAQTDNPHLNDNISVFKNRDEYPDMADENGHAGPKTNSLIADWIVKRYNELNL
jgi:hypothetical protein